MTISYQLEGQDFNALNGDPHQVYADHILLRRSQAQKEVDELGEKLSDGGKKGQCGWL